MKRIALILTLALLSGCASGHVNNLRNHAQTENRRRGEDNPMARLTEADVLDMRYKWAAGWKQTEIARHYGVRQTDVSRIVNRKAWVHV